MKYNNILKIKQLTLIKLTKMNISEEDIQAAIKAQSDADKLTTEKLNEAIFEFKNILRSREFNQSINRESDFQIIYNDLAGFESKWALRILRFPRTSDSHNDDRVRNQELKLLRKYGESITRKMSLSDGIRQKDTVIYCIKKMIQQSSDHLGAGKINWE